MVDYPTHCFDNLRTGWNPQETVLTPATIKQQGLQQITTYNVQGQVYAQPLLVHDIAAPGQPTTDFLIIATQENRIYAFDVYGVSSQNPVWTRQLLPAGERLVVPADIGTCRNIDPYIGITSTPVIDAVRKLMYVCAKSVRVDGSFCHRLYAINLHTGADWKPPVEISATVQYGGKTITFNPQWQLQRPGLLLMNGTIYLGFGAHCDNHAGTYKGWVLAYDANALNQTGAFPSTVTTAGVKGSGGIWQSGCGLAGDGQFVYCVTGNGDFTGNAYDYGNSVLKLSPPSGSTPLQLNGYFTPCSQQFLNDNDLDLGAGGPMLLPDQNGKFLHLLVTAGKDGTIYLLNRDTGLGGYSPPPIPNWQPCDSNNKPSLCANYGAVTTLWALGMDDPCAFPKAVFGGPAYFAPAGNFPPRIYFCGQSDNVRVFEYDATSGQLTNPREQSVDLIDSGAIPVVSSNGGQDGVLWVASRGRANGLRQLLVYNLTPGISLGSALLTKLDAGAWSAGFQSCSDVPTPSLGPPATVANGRVYVGGWNQVVVFGLKPATTGGGCFIAGAVESSASPKLPTLRSLRDDCLNRTQAGKRFVELYEKLSPPVARVIEKSLLLRVIARGLIVWPAFLMAKLVLRRHKPKSSV